MKKNFLVLSCALASCLLPVPIIANWLGADQEAMSIIFWIGPGVIISQAMNATKKTGYLQMIVISAVASLIVSLLGVLGFVILPKLILGTNLLPEPFPFWIIHFGVMNLICLLTMYVTRVKSQGGN